MDGNDRMWMGSLRPRILQADEVIGAAGGGTMLGLGTGSLFRETVQLLSG